MDELGFMEAKAEKFTQRIWELLDDDVPILAAVKKRPDIDFLVRLCKHPKAQVYYLTEENAEELYRELLEKINA